MKTMETFEPILFTNIIEREFMSNPPSKVLPFIRQVAVLTDKDFQKDFRELMNYTINAIKYN